jgi:hypothetical protein
LEKSIEDTLRETLQKIDRKALKWTILATTPPMNILHRATLINSAQIPLYHHVLMALTTTEEDLVPLYKEILTFLCIRTMESEFVQKIR